MPTNDQPKKQPSILGYDIEVPEPKRQTSIAPEHLREQLETNDKRREASIVPDFD